MHISLLNSKGKIIWVKKILLIGYPCASPSYLFELKGGTSVSISADTIEEIVENLAQRKQTELEYS